MEARRETEPAGEAVDIPAFASLQELTTAPAPARWGTVCSSYTRTVLDPLPLVADSTCPLGQEPFEIASRIELGSEAGNKLGQIKFMILRPRLFE